MTVAPLHRLLICVPALVACTVKDTRKATVDSVDAAKRETTLAHAPVPAAPAAKGFQKPASVRYDSALDVFFVVNVNSGFQTNGDSGFISRMRPDGTIDSLRFIAGGRGGASLHAPVGLAITGDTLWVTDLDALRAFDKRTGAPIATIDLKPVGATMLAGIAVAPDGALYITGSGPRVTKDGKHEDRIFKVKGRSASTALRSDSLAAAKGIAWDARGKRFILVQWLGARILAWRPGDATPRTIGFGSNGMMGVAMLPDGRLIMTSWAKQALIIHAGADEYTVRGFGSPGDFAVDTRRGRLVIPMLQQDRVEFWALPLVHP
jgi:hypothetical protein